MSKSRENSVLSKQEVSLLSMSNNKISHYTDEKNLQIQPVYIHD